MEHLATLCNTCRPSIIDSSFIWSSTLEGHEFWYHLNKKFKALTSIGGKNLF